LQTVRWPGIEESIICCSIQLRPPETARFIDSAFCPVAHCEPFADSCAIPRDKFRGESSHGFVSFLAVPTFLRKFRGAECQEFLTIAFAEIWISATKAPSSPDPTQRSPKETVKNSTF
jgi:hypothetical protein